MATESGNEALGTLINTKDSMKTIKNVDMENMFGPMDAFTRDISKTI